MWTWNCSSACSRARPRLRKGIASLLQDAVLKVRLSHTHWPCVSRCTYRASPHAVRARGPLSVKPAKSATPSADTHSSLVPLAQLAAAATHSNTMPLAKLASAQGHEATSPVGRNSKCRAPSA